MGIATTQRQDALEGASARINGPRFWKQAVASAALVVFLMHTGSAALGATGPLAAVEHLEPLVDAVVDALHEGDYRRVGDLIAKARALAPADPGVLWAQAFALAWQGAYDLGAVAGKASFVSLLEAIEAHRKSLERGAPGEARAEYYRGLAALMRARSRIEGKQRRLFKAVSDARRGMRALERAQKMGFAVPDSLFWTGAYRVMASDLPAPLRALRLLIGLPSASRKKGIAELRAAAERSRRFGMEATLLLAAVLADDRHFGFRPAFELLRPALPELSSKGSLLPHYAAVMLSEWGLTRQAVSIWEGVLERHAARPQLYGTLELDRARYLMGRALAQELRWLEASRQFEAILEGDGPRNVRLRERAILWLARCAHRMGNQERGVQLLEQVAGSEKTRRRLLKLLSSPLPDRRIEEELASLLEQWRQQGAPAAYPLLHEFTRLHPDHAPGHFHAGRASFELKRAGDAQRHFTALLELQEIRPLSEDLLGWAHLYLGWLADLEGEREQARLHYRRTRRLKRFDAVRAGDLYLEIPYTSLPSREADAWAFLWVDLDASSPKGPGGGP